MGSEGKDGAELMLDEPVLPPPSEAKVPPNAARPVAPDPEPGQIIAGYQLLERLGRGGAGSVFKAIKDGNVCALKVLSASKVKRARVVQRFFDEVRAASAVDHPGLIKVLDFIEEEDPRRLAYAMEYLDGESLRDRLKRETTIGLRDAIEIAAQICAALHALHQGGIIHRDLKPENIMVAGKGARPLVKLLDFGVVKFLPLDPSGGTKEAEKPGTFVGTPRYMAPEQAAGAPVDHRADLFSIGVILFEMITGRCPHEGDSLRDVVLAKLKGAPRITVNPEKEVLPQELTDLVDACLRLKPALRPKDAVAVANGLRDAEIVLFAVGPIRLADDGSPKREASSDVLEAQPRAPSLPPERAPVESMRPISAPRVEVVAKRSWIGGAVLLVGMVAAAIIIAMIARSLTAEDSAVLVLPDAPVLQAQAGHAKVKIEVVTIPAGATVHVGSTTFGPTPVAVVVEPGQRVIVVLEGYRSEDLHFDGAHEETITLTLARMETVQ